MLFGENTFPLSMLHKSVPQLLSMFEVILKAIPETGMQAEGLNPSPRTEACTVRCWCPERSDPTADRKVWELRNEVASRLAPGVHPLSAA